MRTMRREIELGRVGWLARFPIEPPPLIRCVGRKATSHKANNVLS